MLFQCEATASTAAGSVVPGLTAMAARAASERNTGRRAERACACSALITSSVALLQCHGCSRSRMEAPPLPLHPWHHRWRPRLFRAWSRPHRE